MRLVTPPPRAIDSLSFFISLLLPHIESPTSPYYHHDAPCPSSVCCPTFFPIPSTQPMPTHASLSPSRCAYYTHLHASTHAATWYMHDITRMTYHHARQTPQSYPCPHRHPSIPPLSHVFTDYSCHLPHPSSIYHELSRYCCQI